LDTSDDDYFMTGKTLMQNLQTGLKCRCPNCGKGRIFKSYLKIADTCPECGEELHHHRADDMPAYYAILIVGHVIVTLALAVELSFSPPYWVHFALWFPLTVFMTLAILPPIKGTVLALQWHMGMHGFKHAKQIRETGI
jgi:uncharacterized protein (DUF983 family)